MRRLALLVCIFSLGKPCCARANSQLPPQQWEPGKIYERVESTEDSEQSYALYLPSGYSRERAWPIVFAFDPGARGKVPVELMKDAADRHGFIVAASNNSRNGAWKPQLDSANAMVRDVQLRFSVNTRRFYLAGFSGGARVASQLAQGCKCAAGVLLSGAGFSAGSPPSRESVFPVFLSVGNTDFNYSEVIPLEDKLKQAGFPYWLRVFEGRHQWAPAEVMSEAFAWFRIQAMRANSEPRDDAFISSQLGIFANAAEKENASGSPLVALRMYRQVAATFDGIADVREIKRKADELSRSKSVRGAQRTEENDFAEQERLVGDILESVNALGNIELSRRDVTVYERIRDLRQRSESEKNPGHAVVLKRAIAGVFVSTIEMGDAALEKKNLASAINLYSAAAEARPDAEWPLRQLAVSWALDKNRRAAIETLKRAKGKASDAAEFLHWLETEPAFEDLRNRAELKELGIGH